MSFAPRVEDDLAPVRRPDGRVLVGRIGGEPRRNTARKVEDPDIAAGTGVELAHRRARAIGRNLHVPVVASFADRAHRLPAAIEPGQLRGESARVEARLIGEHAVGDGKRPARRTELRPLYLLDNRNGAAAERQPLRVERLRDERRVLEEEKIAAAVPGVRDRRWKHERPIG